MYGIYLTTKSTRNKIKPNLINGCRSGWPKIASEPTTLPVKVIRESVRTFIEGRNQCKRCSICPSCERMTNNSCFDHWSIAALISSWLIVSQQLIKTCFKWSTSLIFLTVNVRHFHCLAGNSAIIRSTLQPFLMLCAFISSRSSIVNGAIIFTQVTSFELISDVVPLTSILRRIVNIFTKNRCGIQTRRHGRIVCCLMLDNMSTGTKYMEHQTLCGFFCTTL